MTKRRANVSVSYWIAIFLDSKIAVKYKSYSALISEDSGNHSQIKCPPRNKRWQINAPIFLLTYLNNASSGSCLMTSYSIYFISEFNTLSKLNLHKIPALSVLHSLIFFICWILCVTYIVLDAPRYKFNIACKLLFVPRVDFYSLV